MLAFDQHIFLDGVNGSRKTADDKPAYDFAVSDYLYARIAAYNGLDFEDALCKNRQAARDFRLSEARMNAYDSGIETCRSLDESYPLGERAREIRSLYSSVNKLDWDDVDIIHDQKENGNLLQFRKRSA